MNKSDLVQVRPVLVYRPPRYPRANEPLDFRLQDPKRWPFSQAISSLVLGIALESCAYPSGIDPESPAEPAALKPVVVEAENPFAKEKVELVKWGGKGGPSNLPTELAIQTILSVFAEKGITFEKNYAYTQDGVTTKLELYDPKRKIGFDVIHNIAADGPTNNPDNLNQTEELLLAEDIKGAKRSIAVIYKTDKRFINDFYGDTEEIDQNLAKAVREFIVYLQATGAL